MATQHARAKSTKEQSNSVIVSFSSAWRKKLVDKTFSAVIRKRTPKSLTPKWLYVHINSPVSAICGRARIKEVKTISSHEAIRLADELDISANAIRKYVGTYTSVGCYFLSEIVVFDPPLKTEVIRETLEYFPPQSFLVLSHCAKQLIDSYGGMAK